MQWDEHAAILRLKTQRHSYELGSLSAMRGVLRKMNYDRSVQLSGF
jgi:hypothetical protein